MNAEPAPPVPSSFWHTIGRQLQAPVGLGGWLIGQAMRFANAKPNTLAIDALGIAPGDHILELGFGPGHALQIMASRVRDGKLYGVDQSPTMHAQARRRNRPAIRQGRILLYGSPFERLPLKDSSVDKVLAVNVIYFWRDVPAVLNEIGRVLRPDGRVVIYATDAGTMRQWKFASPETHCLYDADSLSQILRQGQFSAGHVAVEEVRIPGGVRGLLATISRNGANGDRSNRLNYTTL